MASATKDNKASAEAKQPEQPAPEQKPAAALEEDDEFEDFPVDGAHQADFLLTLIEETITNGASHVRLGDRRY